MALLRYHEICHLRIFVQSANLIGAIDGALEQKRRASSGHLRRRRRCDEAQLLQVDRSRYHLQMARCCALERRNFQHAAGARARLVDVRRLALVDAGVR